jgi:hypothetical protein
MQKHVNLRFANFNPFGSSLLPGPCDRHHVFAFKTGKARDRFVAEMQLINISVRAVTPREARQRVQPRPDGRRYFRTLSGDFATC